jgi:hypothetical protein
LPGAAEILKTSPRRETIASSCRLTASELPSEAEVTAIRKAKYKDTGTMALDVK